VTDLLIATDAPWIRDDVAAALDDDTELRWVRTGAAVRAAVHDRVPDLAILDLQIGNMGGMAVCLDLRLEESGDRMPHVPVLMLLDRPADVFLGRRSGAEGWLIKPLDALRLRRALRAILDGGTYFEATGIASEGVLAQHAPDDEPEPVA
jgi:DNA-binding response OmpR family regulator